jgi:hypothetical protein
MTFSGILCRKHNADFTDFQLYFLPLHRFYAAVHGVLCRFSGFEG